MPMHADRDMHDAMDTSRFYADVGELPSVDDLDVAAAAAQAALEVLTGGPGMAPAAAPAASAGRKGQGGVIKGQGHGQGQQGGSSSSEEEEDSSSDDDDSNEDSSEEEGSSDEEMVRAAAGRAGVGGQA